MTFLKGQIPQSIFQMRNLNSTHQIKTVECDRNIKHFKNEFLILSFKTMTEMQTKKKLSIQFVDISMVQPNDTENLIVSY